MEGAKSEIMPGRHVRQYTPSDSNTYPIRIIQIPRGYGGEIITPELIKCLWEIEEKYLICTGAYNAIGGMLAEMSWG